MSETMVVRGDLQRGVALCVTGDNKLEAGDCRDQDRLSIVGLTAEVVLDGETLRGCVSTGTMMGVLVGANGGEQFYLGPTGAPTRFKDLPDGAWILQIGFALNEKDLWIRLSYATRRKVN